MPAYNRNLQEKPMQTRTLHHLEATPSDDDDTLSTSAVVLWVVFVSVAMDFAVRWLT